MSLLKFVQFAALVQPLIASGAGRDTVRKGAGSEIGCEGGTDVNVDALRSDRKNI